MKKQFFENEKDGFYGTYYENPKGADCAGCSAARGYDLHRCAPAIIPADGI